MVEAPKLSSDFLFRKERYRHLNYFCYAKSKHLRELVQKIASFPFLCPSHADDPYFDEPDSSHAFELEPSEVKMRSKVVFNGASLTIHSDRHHPDAKLFRKALKKWLAKNGGYRDYGDRDSYIYSIGITGPSPSQKKSEGVDKKVVALYIRKNKQFFDKFSNFLDQWRKRVGFLGWLKGVFGR